MKRNLFLLSLLMIGLNSCGTTYYSVPIQKETVVIDNQIIKLKVEDTSISTTSVQEAVEKVYDSVVVINSYSSNGYSSGSGVLFASSEEYSYIVTCHHVIEGCSSYEVILSNNENYEATLIGGDPTTDIAVLAISDVDLTYSAFVEDDKTVKIGSTAIAIGNPLGTLSNTVTCGIVSATNREIKTSDGQIHELLQTDAAINSGNSGGGLFNTAGELIGIVNAKYSASGVEGLGFAIPSSIAMDIASELCEHGYIEGRYQLGISISDGTYMSGGIFGNRYSVIYISSVDSLGCCYGLLKKEDILCGVKINYADTSKESKTLEEIKDAAQVEKFIKDAELSIGDVIQFAIKRGGYNATSTIVDVEVTQYKYVG